MPAFPDIAAIIHSNVFYVRGDFIPLDSDTPEDRVRYVFTKGNCHSFALAVCKLTGWRLIGLFAPYDPMMADHIAAQAPDGRLFDINGFGVENRYRYMEERPITRQQIAAWVRQFNRGRTGYIPCKVQATIPFAEKKLRESGVL